MGRTFIQLIVPFTFSEEDEYRVSLSNRVALIRIKHIKNNNGIETIKGIKFHGNPKIVPDDPEGSMYISSIEIELPYTPRDLKSLGGLEVEFVKNHVMSYLNRLTETIRFSTRRYWIKMISEKDIDIYDIEFEENSGGKWSIPLIIGVQSGYNFPLSIFNEKRVKKFITEILTKEIQLPLSENLYFDALNFYYSGRFSESIVVANISFEVFLNTYLIEKLNYEGKSIEEAKDYVEKIFKNGIQEGIRKIFFDDNKHKNLGHPIYRICINMRNTRKQVIHPYVKKISQEKTFDLLRDILLIRQWIIDNFPSRNHYHYYNLLPINF